MVECLNALVATVNHFYYLFSSDAEIKDKEKYETLVTDTSFVIESLKDDGFVISKIPSYLKSILSYFKP